MQPAPESATLLDFWIGDFNFHSMEGFPEEIKQRPIVESRPGVHGVAMFLSGLRGESTTIRTFRDTIDMADSAAVYQNYLATIGGQYLVMYAGQQFTTPFLVENVRMARQPKVVFGIGGVQTPQPFKYSFIECEWTLIAQYIPPEDP